MDPQDQLLTPRQVADLFRVDPKTVTRWANHGRIPCVVTPGGHRRFYESQVRMLLRVALVTDGALIRGEVHDGSPTA